MSKRASVPGFHETKYTEDRHFAYLKELEAFFEGTPGTALEKLENFPKHVPRTAILRLLVKYELFKQVIGVHGSVVECGVLHGGGLMTWAQLSAIMEPANHQRKVIGFDTFAGFPSISEKDRGSVSDFIGEGQLAVDSYDNLLEGVRIFDMTRYLGHIGKVELVKGDIIKTLPAYVERNQHLVVSLLYLDVDLFDPTRVALEQLVPRMPKGAIIAFDELNMPTWPGETQAVLAALGVRNLEIRRFQMGTSISYAVL
jgi:macrocin-O-methyltransferase TylF-like protien